MKSCYDSLLNKNLHSLRADTQTLPMIRRTLNRALNTLDGMLLLLPLKRMVIQFSSKNQLKFINFSPEKGHRHDLMILFC